MIKIGRSVIKVRGNWFSIFRDGNLMWETGSKRYALQYVLSLEVK